VTSPGNFSAQVGESDAGGTLASFLRSRSPGLTWSQARELCRSGRVRVDGEPTREDALRLRTGSVVELVAPGAARRAADELIVHLDRDVAVVRKPAGLLTVPYEDEKDTLQQRAAAAVRRRAAHEGIGGSPALRVVQRLDKETSGILVFARNVAAERHLQAQLKQHSVERLYLALVEGEARDGTHESWLVANRGDGLRGSWGKLRRTSAPPPEQARRALTHVRVLERLAGATLVACELETGRQHQIRIHVAEDGHPLVGETVYIRDYQGKRHAAPRPMLHATVLGFTHPRTHRRLRFEEPPPADFERTLAELRQSATPTASGGRSARR
jgi:23S rRNA pseudouridine1911/1915/1917 synthase